MKLLTASLLLLITVSSYAQQPAAIPLVHELHGTIVDSSGAAIGGLRLAANNKLASVTNSEGEFSLQLPVGDYVLVAVPEPPYHFRAYLKIVEKGPNPDNVIFTFDMSEVCCFSSGVRFPKLISLPKPSYPPAARAVRATGEVIVVVTISADGKVTKATAISAHPLLRAASESAARGATFEPGTVPEREARLSYVFLLDVNDERNKNARKRYTSPFRIQVSGPFSEIQY